MLERIKEQEWFEGLLDFVFPPICLGCSEFCENKSQICDYCIQLIEPFDHPLCLNCRAFVPTGIECPICKEKSVLLFAYADYKPPLKEIILQFKFKGITSPAVTFARLACEKFQDKLPNLKADFIIPIPLHPTRENRRGYNQAELIANEISQILEIPVASDILYRTKRRQPQARLNFKKRLANINGVFESDNSDKANSKVILVDDVVTSGATVLEARKVLQSAGYKIAGIISIAHGV